MNGSTRPGRGWRPEFAGMQDFMALLKRFDDLEAGILQRRNDPKREDRWRESVERLWAVYAQRFERVFGQTMAKTAEDAMERVAESSRMVYSSTQKLVNRVTKLEENMRLAASASVLQGTRELAQDLLRQVEELRAEVRSDNPKLGAVQLVPQHEKMLQDLNQRVNALQQSGVTPLVSNHHKLLGQHEQRLAEIEKSVHSSATGRDLIAQDRRIGALELTAGIRQEQYQIKVIGSKGPEEAARLYEQSPCNGDEGYSRENWPMRRQAFIHGYIQALADSPSLETLQRQLNGAHDDYKRLDRDAHSVKDSLTRQLDDAKREIAQLKRDHEFLRDAYNQVTFDRDNAKVKR